MRNKCLSFFQFPVRTGTVCMSSPLLRKRTLGGGGTKRFNLESVRIAILEQRVMSFQDLLKIEEQNIKEYSESADKALRELEEVTEISKRAASQLSLKTLVPTDPSEPCAEALEAARVEIRGLLAGAFAGCDTERLDALLQMAALQRRTASAIQRDTRDQARCEEVAETMRAKEQQITELTRELNDIQSFVRTSSCEVDDAAAAHGDGDGGDGGAVSAAPAVTFKEAEQRDLMQGIISRNRALSTERDALAELLAKTSADCTSAEAALAVVQEKEVALERNAARNDAELRYNEELDETKRVQAEAQERRHELARSELVRQKAWQDAVSDFSAFAKRTASDLGAAQTQLDQLHAEIEAARAATTQGTTDLAELRTIHEPLCATVTDLLARARGVREQVERGAADEDSLLECIEAIAASLEESEERTKKLTETNKRLRETQATAEVVARVPVSPAQRREQDGIERTLALREHHLQASLAAIMAAKEAYVTQALELEDASIAHGLETAALNAKLATDITRRRANSCEVDGLRSELQKANAALEKRTKVFAHQEEQITLFRSQLTSLDARREAILRFLRGDRSEETLRASENENKRMHQSIVCNICQERHKDMVIKTCGHTACAVCLRENIASRSRKCPFCMQRFGETDLMPISLDS
eukprot:gnl/Chilomastix_cuspidata/399.p2 GENE.gnl/Chilomastix_cuspidata/399~~gnl/Chilomastix_cuspidata/399.p2  ORF type:complete len:653 (-),score=201.54 gnl/Chilomastix_cuspidata/399:1996-3954(-)